MNGIVKLGYQPKLFFSPNVFRQANLEEFPKIISKIRAFTPKNCKLLELYGGGMPSSWTYL